jgi:CheY-like chemotaxis protein
VSKKRILVVDDDAIIVNRLAAKLKASGYEAVLAMDGSEAVSAVRHARPDLILLDITFPPDVAHGGGVGWDGFLIIQWLRRMDEVKDVPIIVITGSDAAKYRDKALAAGAIDFFHKPIDNEGLLAAIRKALGEEAPAPETGGA